MYYMYRVSDTNMTPTLVLNCIFSYSVFLQLLCVSDVSVVFDAVSL